MGLLDELKKLTKPYTGDEYDDFDDEYAEAPKETYIAPETSGKSYVSERRNPFSDYDTGRSSRSSESISRVNSLAQRRDKVVNINPASQVQLVLVKPERFETAAEIADHLRDRRPVLMNLEQAPKDVSRRLLDFLSGVAYALDGKIRKIAASTYILTPYNVDVMGDLIDELENTGLYM